MTRIQPETEAQLHEAVRDALARRIQLEIEGGGTKAHVGTPERRPAILSTSGLRGIVDYDPAELVLTVRAGTHLSEVQAALCERRQHLAFEPSGSEGATIGGIVAAGISGSRRISAGAARDHLLGFRAVSGRGEIFVAGGKVVKNVTGYDLAKLMTGSWGRLAVMSEMTLKVLPAPHMHRTLVWEGLTLDAAWSLMGRAMGLPADVAATAYRPANGSHPSQALVRLEGVEPSVHARTRLLAHVFAEFGAPAEQDGHVAAPLWQAVRNGAGVKGSLPLWRLSLPPRNALALARRLETEGADWLADWAGGLIWARTGLVPAELRALAAQAGGHAQLAEADPQLRRQVPALHLPAPGLAALNARVRRAFDPAGLFETGRFLDQADAD